MDTFVKFESYAKGDGDIIERFDPRLIILFDESFVVTVGPFYHALGNHMKEVMFPHSHGFISREQPRLYVYASGMNATDLGEWLYYWREYMQTQSCWTPYGVNLNQYHLIEIEGDCSRFDGHKLAKVKAINDKFNLSFIEPKFRNLMKIQLVKTMDTNIKIKTPDGELIFRTSGRHQSGHTSTSVDNSETNIGLTEKALFNCQEALVGENEMIFGVTTVLGDDNYGLLLVPRTINMTNFNDMMVREYKALNQELELLVHVGDREPIGSFCSGYFYCVLDGLKETYLWAPKIGRILSKLAWVKDHRFNPNDFLYSLLVAYRHVFPHIPILRAYYTKSITILEALDAKIIDLPKEYEFRITTNHQGYNVSNLIYDQLYSIYGITVIEIFELEEYINTRSDFELLDHPVLTKIMEVDAPVKRDLDVGDFIPGTPISPPGPQLWLSAKKFINAMWERRLGHDVAEIWAKFERPFNLLPHFIARSFGIDLAGFARFLPFLNNVKVPEVDWDHVTEDLGRIVNRHIPRGEINFNLYNVGLLFFSFKFMPIKAWFISFLAFCKRPDQAVCVLGAPVYEEMLKSYPLIHKYFWLFETFVNVSLTLYRYPSIADTYCPWFTVSMCYATSAISRYLLHSVLTRGDFETRVSRHAYWNAFCVFFIDSRVPFSPHDPV